jgi:hypothetical protein
MASSIGRRACRLHPPFSVGTPPFRMGGAARLATVSWLLLALLALAVAVLVGAEWPRLEGRLGLDARRARPRARRKAGLRVVRTEEPLSEQDEFAASVERDLAQLPTLDEERGK